MKSKKAWIITTAACLAIVLGGLCVAYAVVAINASGRLYDKAEDVTEMEYGLLLGTSPITPQGAHNYSFDNRIKAALELYQIGRVRKLILSGGDYSGKQKNGCNELSTENGSICSRPLRSGYVI